MDQQPQKISTCTHAAVGTCGCTHTTLSGATVAPLRGRAGRVDRAIAPHLFIGIVAGGPVRPALQLRPRARPRRGAQARVAARRGGWVRECIGRIWRYPHSESISVEMDCQFISDVLHQWQLLSHLLHHWQFISHLLTHWQFISRLLHSLPSHFTLIAMISL